MTIAPTEADGRVPRLLIPDNTPLSLLGMIGPEALDWLFVVGAEVWVTDMVREEALREPEPGGDLRTRHRRVISDWFAANAGRIHIQTTAEGESYANAMDLWIRAGRPPDARPPWRNRGERSILQVLDGAEALLERGECVVAIVDDRKARAAIQLVPRLDLDLMGTRTFLRWIEDAFGVTEAGSAWVTIAAAANARVPADPAEDPILIRPTSPRHRPARAHRPGDRRQRRDEETP